MVASERGMMWSKVAAIRSEAPRLGSTGAWHSWQVHRSRSYMANLSARLMNWSSLPLRRYLRERQAPSRSLTVAAYRRCSAAAAARPAFLGAVQGAALPGGVVGATMLAVG